MQFWKENLYFGRSKNNLESFHLVTFWTILTGQCQRPFFQWYILLQEPHHQIQVYANQPWFSQLALQLSNQNNYQYNAQYIIHINLQGVPLKLMTIIQINLQDVPQNMKIIFQVNL